MDLWREIVSNQPAAIEQMAKEYNVHPLAIEDCIHRNQRAKLEDFGDHQFLVWFMVTQGEVHELQFILRPERLIFVPHEHPPEGATWAEYLRLNPAARDPWHLLYQALDRATDLSAIEVRQLTQEIDDFEVRIFTEPFDPQTLLRFKRRLLDIEYALEQLPSVAKQLQSFHPPGDDLSWKWRDLHDHCERTSQKIAHAKAQIVATIDLYWGHQAHKSNRQIKKLSMLASVSLPLTFWTSFWGMNFSALPFADSRLFLVAIGIMAGSAFFTVWLLIRRGYWK